MPSGMDYRGTRRSRPCAACGRACGRTGPTVSEDVAARNCLDHRRGPRSRWSTTPTRTTRPRHPGPMRGDLAVRGAIRPRPARKRIDGIHYFRGPEPWSHLAGMAPARCPARHQVDTLPRVARVLRGAASAAPARRCREPVDKVHAGCGRARSRSAGCCGRKPPRAGAHNPWRDVSPPPSPPAGSVPARCHSDQQLVDDARCSSAAAPGPAGASIPPAGADVLGGNSKSTHTVPCSAPRSRPARSPAFRAVRDGTRTPNPPRVGHAATTSRQG